MNNFPITLTVESSDGVQFTVETMTLNVVGEVAFARSKTAEQLDAHGDFKRVGNRLLTGDEVYDKIMASIRAEGYAFFYWHRGHHENAVGDTACHSSGNPRSFCRKAWDYKWEVT